MATSPHFDVTRLPPQAGIADAREEVHQEMDPPAAIPPEVARRLADGTYLTRHAAEALAAAFFARWGSRHG